MILMMIMVVVVIMMVKTVDVVMNDDYDGDDGMGCDDSYLDYDEQGKLPIVVQRNRDIVMVQVKHQQSQQASMEASLCYPQYHHLSSWKILIVTLQILVALFQ